MLKPSLIFSLPFALFLSQLIFLAIYQRYGFPPDETFHLNVTKTYAATTALRLPFSLDSLRWGALSAWPYLYHRVLGALIAPAIDSGYELAFLRTFNVLLSCLWFFGSLSLIKRLTSSEPAQLLALMVLANIPMLLVISGAVSYDNFINLLSVILLIYLFDFLKEPNLTRLLVMASLLGAGSIAKITFLPWIPVFFVIIVLFTPWKRFSFRSKGVVSMAVLTILTGVLFLDVYLRNFIEHGTIFPSVTQVAGYENALRHYPPTSIHEEWREIGRQKEELLSFPAWFAKYIYMAAQSTLGLQAHRNYGRSAEDLRYYSWLAFSLIPGLFYWLYSRSFRNLRTPASGVIFAGILYLMIMVAENYITYLNMRMFGVSLQGRYLFPAFPVLAFIASYLSCEWLRLPVLKWIGAGLISLTLVVLGLPSIVSDSSTWNYLFRKDAWLYTNTEEADLPQANTSSDKRFRVIDKQEVRSDGIAVTDKIWYRQHFPATPVEVNAAELFLIAGKEYLISFSDCDKPIETLATYTATVSGFQIVEMKSLKKGSTMCLTIAGTNATSSDVGTSSPSSNPHPGDFEVSTDQGASWEKVDRDLSFTLFGERIDQQEDVLFTKYGNFGQGYFIDSEYFLTTLDGRLAVVTLEKRKIRYTLVSADSLAVSQNLFIATSSSDKRLRIYRFEDGKITPLGALTDGKLSKSDLALTKSGPTWYASFSADSRLYVLSSTDLTDWQSVNDIPDAKTSEVSPGANTLDKGLVAYLENDSGKKVLTIRRLQQN